MAIKILHEKWPAAVDQFLDRDSKRKLATSLKAKGLDIENTDYEVVKMSSSRDPRIRSGVVFVRFSDAGRNKNKPSVGVWVDGQCIKDVYLGVDDRYRDIYASRMSWRNILSRSDIEVYRMVIDPDTAKAMLNKRSSRGDAKYGTQLRYRNYKKQSTYDPNKWYDDNRDEFGHSPARNAKLDKSGYVLPNVDKYKDKLAELQIKDSQDILQKAADVYANLSSQLMNRRGERDAYLNDSYRSLIRRIPELFYSLSYALEDYEKNKSRWGDDSYSRGRVVSVLKDIRNTLKSAEKYTNAE